MHDPLFSFCLDSKLSDQSSHGSSCLHEFDEQSSRYADNKTILGDKSKMCEDFLSFNFVVFGAPKSPRKR